MLFGSHVQHLAGWNMNNEADPIMNIILNIFLREPLLDCLKVGGFRQVVGAPTFCMMDKLWPQSFLQYTGFTIYTVYLQNYNDIELLKWGGFETWIEHGLPYISQL